MREAPAYKLKMAPRELILIVPLVVEFSTRVTLLLQLNGIILKWKIQQISQNAATEAAKTTVQSCAVDIFSSLSTGLECSYEPGQPRSRSPRPASIVVITTCLARVCALPTARLSPQRVAVIIFTGTRRRIAAVVFSRAVSSHSGSTQKQHSRKNNEHQHVEIAVLLSLA